MRGSESQRVVEQISQRALEQVWVGINLAVAAAIDRNIVIVCDRLIKSRDFLDRGARIESLPRNRFASCVHPRDKKQIVHDSGEPFAFGNGGFDGLAIVGSGAISREGNLRFD